MAARGKIGERGGRRLARSRRRWRRNLFRRRRRQSPRQRAQSSRRRSPRAKPRSLRQRQLRSWAPSDKKIPARAASALALVTRTSRISESDCARSIERMAPRSRSRAAISLASTSARVRASAAARLAASRPAASRSAALRASRTASRDRFGALYLCRRHQLVDRRARMAGDIVAKARRECFERAAKLFVKSHREPSDSAVAWMRSIIP